LGSGGSQLGGPIAQAATLSSATPGYRMHMAVEVTSPALGAPITATGSGLVDLRDHAASMSLLMDLSDQPQVAQQLGSSTMRLDMISEGSAAYVRLPSEIAGSLSVSGKRWVKVDLGRLSSLPGLSALQSNPAGGDPVQFLQSLRSASHSVLDLGQQRLGNVPTTHYRAQLSLGHLVDGLPSAARNALTRALPGGSLPVDVWIDGQHLVRRVLIALDLNLPTGPSLQETVTVDLSHYGLQPRPAVPPSSEVLDVSSLARAAG